MKLLDPNFAGVSSAPAALALTARAIPFFVVSGYSESQQHGAHAAGLNVSKPFSPETLFAALRSILPTVPTLPT
jgi:CheY-like chemotaxis protein